MENSKFNKLKIGYKLELMNGDIVEIVTIQKGYYGCEFDSGVRIVVYPKDVKSIVIK